MTVPGLCAPAVIPGLDSVDGLWQPLTRLPWSSWNAVWLGDTLAGRNAVLIFLPLLVVLMLLPPGHLRRGFILTGLLFVGYVFGAAYLVFWLLSCLLFYRLSEQFAREVRRTDVWPGGPPLAAIAIISVYFVLVHVLDAVNLPAAANAWLMQYAPWVYPLGARGLSWEPHWFGTESQLFALMLRDSHNIGAAYLVMRLVHYFSELKRGTIPPEQRSFARFLAYLCYVPTLIQGPIERYAEFNHQIDTCHERRTWRDRLAGLGRLGQALVKAVVLEAYLLPWANSQGLGSRQFMQHPEHTTSYVLLFFSIHVLVFALYLAFSAYCDVAIGLSRLLGYRAAENFRYFWLACSLTDMWRRWHITLSFILRDYIFFPLARRRWNSFLALAVTFLVCGLWHSLSLNYALWGLTMGLLVAVNQRWSRWQRQLERQPDRRLARLRRAWLRLQPLPRICAWLLTINVFMLSGWVCFWGFRGFRVLGELVWRPLAWLCAGQP